MFHLALFDLRQASFVAVVSPSTIKNSHNTSRTMSLILWYLVFQPANEVDEWRFGKLSSSSIDWEYL